MKKKIILLLIVIPMVFFLSYLLKGFILRYILAPITYAVRIEYILYEALPQYIWWGIFLLILTAIGLHGFFRGHKSKSIVSEPPIEQPMSRARKWNRWIEMSQRGNYSKWMLARHFADLTLKILEYEERKPYELVRERILANKEEIPAEVQDYLEVGLNTPSFRHFSEYLGKKRWIHFPSLQFIKRFVCNPLRWKEKLSAINDFRSERSEQSAVLNLDPEVILQFLESIIPPGGSL